MTSLSAHPLQARWDSIISSIQADAVDAALELKLFDALLKPADAADISQRLGTHVTHTAYLLDLLCAMSLLRRVTQVEIASNHQKSYVNSEDADRYLCSRSPFYCGDALRFRLRTARWFGARLPELLRSGPSASTSWTDRGNWAEAAAIQIAQEQRTVTAASAVAAVSRFPDFQRAQRFLDLGGGPGLIGIAFAKTRSTLSGVIFDLPTTAAVAERNIADAGLEKQLSVQGGDLNQDPLGTDFDFVWCSSVLHFVTDLRSTLRRILECLRPGGLLICAHAELPFDPKEAAPILSFYLPLLMSNRQVTSEGEIATGLREVGYEQIVDEGLLACPVTPVRLLTARRPRP